MLVVCHSLDCCSCALAFTLLHKLGRGKGEGMCEGDGEEVWCVMRGRCIKENVCVGREACCKVNEKVCVMGGVSGGVGREKVECKHVIVVCSESAMCSDGVMVMVLW